MNEPLTPTRQRDASRSKTSRDFNEAATELILQYGPVILDDARRFSSCVADAEDAYQRTLEILLTRAPTSDPSQLVPWLRIVARREAADIARHRRRVVSAPEVYPHDRVPHHDELPEDAAVNSVDLELGAEALQRLDSDQVQCLLAHAEGHSYNEIAVLTGFSHRKVKRCLLEGRRAFATRVHAIESGSECERVEPLLHRALDGDVAAYKDARPHVNRCGRCRSTLRAYSEAPSRAAALFPLPLVVAMPQATPASSGLWDSAAGIWATIYEKLVMHSTTVQQWAEAGSVKKAGVVAATAAAFAAGSVAVESTVDRTDGQAPEQVAERPADAGPTPVAAPELDPPANPEPKAPDTGPAAEREPELAPKPAEQPGDLLAPETVATNPPPAPVRRKTGGSGNRAAAGTGDLAP
ncbi:MAG: sigma-70 family RNA polymerase sigma factor [Solirubrobacterales bacterium]